MLTLTTKSHYGIAALVELARHYNNGLVQIKDIVEHQDIPKNYLEQLLNQLQKAGLVKSVRGIKGGYELSSPPDQILLLDILETLEGKIEVNGEPRLKSLGSVYDHIVQIIKKELAVSLAEILEREQELHQFPMFYI